MPSTVSVQGPPPATRGRDGPRDTAVPTPPEGLTRLTRLGAALLDRPVQLVAVTPTGTVRLAATPSTAAPVPGAVARRLAASTGAMTIDRDDGPWLGAPAGTWGHDVHTCCCTRAAPDGGRTRAVLADLAALAADVLRQQAAADDAAGLRHLLGTVNHDLRSPLAVLRAGLETLMLRRDELDEQERDRIAGLAVRQARRMQGMVDHLLSLHGLEEDPELLPVDLVVLLREAHEAARLHHPHVSFRGLEGLPATPLVVLGVADSLARLLANLLSNAAEHGGGTVWLGLREQDGAAVVQVADDGPGLPRDCALDTGVRASREGGHGLGLLIAHRVADVHGGSIQHADRDGGGTVIEVTVPLAA